MVAILFGVAGCGKNYVGRILKAELGFFFYDLDRVLTEPMKHAISNQREISDRVRDQYIDVAIHKVLELSGIHQRLAVAQAFFKDKHRRVLLDTLPDARLIWVQTEPEIIKARLVRTTGQIATDYFINVINRGFEPPTASHLVLTNNAGRAEVLRQLERLSLNSESEA